MAVKQTGKEQGGFTLIELLVVIAIIAILAALNIADEFSRYRKQREHASGSWIEKTEELSDRLSKVIS